MDKKKPTLSSKLEEIQSIYGSNLDEWLTAMPYKGKAIPLFRQYLENKDITAMSLAQGQPKVRIRNSIKAVIDHLLSKRTKLLFEKWWMLSELVTAKKIDQHSFDTYTLYIPSFTMLINWQTLQKIVLGKSDIDGKDFTLSRIQSNQFVEKQLLSIDLRVRLRSESEL